MNIEVVGGSVIGFIGILAGTIYHDVLRRIRNNEKLIEKIFPTVLEISSDVKHIKSHCVMCIDEDEKKKP